MSVARTVVPEVPVGTMNVHENAPVGLDTRLPLVQATMETPPSVNDTVELSEKPEPVAVTVAPEGPRVGATLSASGVTVNAPEADWPPASVAWTVVPDVPLGTANVQLNEPVASVVRLPLAHE